MENDISQCRVQGQLLCLRQEWREDNCFDGGRNGERCCNKGKNGEHCCDGGRNCKNHLRDLP